MAARGNSGRFLLAGREIEAQPLPGGLYLVATPIGNLRDISLRALETLSAAGTIACEDTRVSAKLLAHYGIRASLVPYHDHNADSARPKILARLAEGQAVALVSDAGTPLISDPGYKLARAAREAGFPVTAIPGASSVTVALSLAGLPTDRFFFEGFLPAKSGARARRASELARIPATLVLFETGARVAAALADLATALGAREAAICRELTKLHEEVRRGPLDALAADYAKEEAERRGEFVIVIAPPAADERPEPAELDALIRAALRRGSVKDAASEVSEMTGLARRDIYQRALALAKDKP